MSLDQPAQVLSFTTAVVKRAKVSPFLVGAKCMLHVPAGAASTVSRCDHPGDGDTEKYAVFKATGAQTSYTMPTALNDLDDQANAGLNDANRMRVILLVNGSPIVRVGNDATPSAGQFQQTDANTIVTGSTYAAGTKIEVLAMDAADITSTSSLAAGSWTAETCHSFYTATAPATLAAVKRG